MRSGEVRMLQWDRFVLGPSPGQSYVRVGASKTEGGEDRAIPMTPLLWTVIAEYHAWYESKLGSIRPEWYVFPFANRRKPVDPSRPTTTVKSAWQALKADLGVDYRLHDTRHTVATAMAIGNVPEAKRRYLMGHVDEKVIKRYTHFKADDCRDDFVRALANRHTPQEVPTVSPTVRRKTKKASA
jgi:integrase